MSLDILREDALASTDSGFALRLSLPWIRSLPASNLTGLRVTIDGIDVSDPQIGLSGRTVTVSALASETGWWFIQDRLVVVGAAPIPLGGAHQVGVSFQLLIPYLQSAPDAPLTLPFHAERSLVIDAAASVPTISRDVA